MYAGNLSGSLRRTYGSTELGDNRQWSALRRGEAAGGRSLLWDLADE